MGQCNDYRKAAILLGAERACHVEMWSLRCADRCGKMFTAKERDSDIFRVGRKTLAKRAYDAGWNIDGDGSIYCPECWQALVQRAEASDTDLMASVEAWKAK